MLSLRGKIDGTSYDLSDCPCSLYLKERAELLHQEQDVALKVEGKMVVERLGGEQKPETVCFQLVTLLLVASGITSNYF